MGDLVTSSSGELTAIAVDVRFFAAARAAAGADSETVTVSSGATIGELVDALAGRDAQLAKVLARCSYLRDGIAVRDTSTTLRAGDTIDVLPPFAGG